MFTEVSGLGLWLRLMHMAWIKPQCRARLASCGRWLHLRARKPRGSDLRRAVARSLLSSMASSDVLLVRLVLQRFLEGFAQLLRGLVEHPMDALGGLGPHGAVG